jgi:ATP-dependent Zn protease
MRTQSWFSELLFSWMLPFVIIAAIWGYGASRMRQGLAGALTFGKNRAKIYDQSSQNKATFSLSLSSH